MLSAGSGFFATAQYPCYWLGKNGNFEVNEAAENLPLAHEVSAQVRLLLQNELDTCQQEPKTTMQALAKPVLETHGLVLLPSGEGVLAAMVSPRGWLCLF